MSSEQEIRAVRLGKIEQLSSAGMDSYPEDVTRDMRLKQASENFAELESNDTSATLTGRVMALRGQGAIVFCVLQDGADQFQAVCKADELDAEAFDLFKRTVDRGDFIAVTGTFFRTKRDHESLLVKDWSMATKSLLPLPEKWHGVVDTDIRYRKRYLELVSDPEAFARFTLRSQVTAAIRRYMQDELGFLEVETPILQSQAGGAMARTFDTHHNDHDEPMVLRIALELDHKILMAGGFDRIFEIGKNFRNEGSDPTHIQEFTMMEWYAAFASLEDNLNWTEEMLKHLAKDVVGQSVFTVYDKQGNGVEVDFDTQWPRKRFDELLTEQTGLSVATASIDDVRSKAIELGLSSDEAASTGRGNLLDFVFKKAVRQNIVNPTFVTNYPSELKPLAQQNDDGTAQVAQLIIGGAEITNQYAELVDPIKQRELLEQQADAKAAGDDEAMSVDERFLTAMEHGMPPMTGFGMGIDRLMAIFTNQRNIRDVIFFPIMKQGTDHEIQAE